MANFYSTIAIAFKDKVECVVEHNQVPNAPTATSEMRSFENALSQYSVKEDVELKAVNGWLSPDGILFACRWREHTNAISVLGFAHEHEITKNGWIKLSQMKWMIMKRYETVSISEAQIDTILRWHQVNFLSDELFYFYKNSSPES